VLLLGGTRVPELRRAHVLYERTQGANRDFTVRVDPDSGVDVSLYYLQRSAGNTSMPPDVACESVFDCDAMADYEDDANPGSRGPLHRGQQRVQTSYRRRGTDARPKGRSRSRSGTPGQDFDTAR